MSRCLVFVLMSVFLFAEAPSARAIDFKKALKDTLEKEKKKLEEKHKKDEQRKADESNKAAEAKKAEDARKADEARRAEEAQKAEEARKADEARRVEEAKKAEEARKAAEVKRLEEEKKAEAEANAAKAKEEALKNMTPAQRIKFAWENFPFYQNGCTQWDKPHKLAVKFDDSSGLTTACRVLGLIDLATLEKMSGQPVFSSGPHADKKMNLGSVTFGQFNPKFVRWAVNNAIPGSKDKAFRLATQKIYEDYFQVNVESFLKTIYALESRPKFFKKIKSDYAAAVKSKKYILTSMFFSGAYEQLPAGGTNFREVAFWVRRSTDGSALPLKQGLEKLVKTYTPGRFKEVKKEALAPKKQ
jgi:hypothetical protein